MYLAVRLLSEFLRQLRLPILGSVEDMHDADCRFRNTIMDSGAIALVDRPRQWLPFVLGRAGTL